MSDVTFQLDILAAAEILTTMAAPMVKQSAEQIAARAKSMATSLSTQEVDITVENSVGTLRKGKRAIATITAQGANAHTSYVGYEALAKAKDAGRV